MKKEKKKKALLASLYSPIYPIYPILSYPPHIEGGFIYDENKTDYW